MASGYGAIEVKRGWPPELRGVEVVGPVDNIAGFMDRHPLITWIVGTQ